MSKPRLRCLPPRVATLQPKLPTVPRPSRSGDAQYGSRWRSARERYLRLHPLCVFCQQAGRIKAASVVDHVRPHKGDALLFWDERNWQALCAPCHNAVKQKQERSGVLPGAAVDGTPLDPAHPWNRTPP